MLSKVASIIDNRCKGKVIGKHFSLAEIDFFEYSFITTVISSHSTATYVQKYNLQCIYSKI